MKNVIIGKMRTKGKLIMEDEKNNGFEDTTTEIIKYDDDVIRKAKRAIESTEAVSLIKRASLRLTNAHDWSNQNGKPYLEVSGAEKVANWFGIAWKIDEPKLEYEDDGNYSYTYKGSFSFQGRSIEVIGARGTMDGFFTGSDKKPKPVSEVDRNDVKKSALTNLIGNGITRILGIRNLTWADLAEAGIKKEDVKSIEYKAPEMTEESKDLRDKIEKMLNEMAGGDPKKFAAGLCKITSFIGKDGKEVKGKSKLDDLSEKAIPVTYGKLEKVYEEWKKTHDTAEDIETGFEMAEQAGRV